MKILFLLPRITRSGPCNVVASLVANEKMHNNELFISSFLGFEQEALDKFEQYNVHYIPLLGPGIKGLSALRTLINEHNIDVVHSHGLIPDVAVGLLSPLIKCHTVSTIHCDLFNGYLMEYPRIKAHVYLNIHRLFLSFIQQKIAVSSPVQQVLPHKSTVIRNGVQPRLITLPASNKLSLVFAGRLIALKNVQFAIDCVNQLNIKKWSSIELVVIGDGELYELLKSQENDRIRVIGFHHDFVSTLTDNSLFINPSLSEGFPMAVIEALSACVPCLLSAIDSHQEIQRCCPSGVALFDFTFEAFESALESMTSNGKVTVNRQLIEEHFFDNLSDKQMTERYLNVFACNN